MKKAIVTGHSKGLGAGLVQSLIHAGFDVLGVSRSALGETDDHLSEVALDLADEAAVSAFASGEDFARFLAGATDAVLINNAGIVEPVAPIGRQNASLVARAIAVNVTGPLLLTNAFVAATQGAADRRVAHISSGAGRNAYTGWSVYCATKAALDMHARAMVEDGVTALKVESIAPGVIDTGMQATIRATPEEDFSILDQFKAMKEEGALAQAQDTADKITAHILSAGFGSETITDVRQF
ncbi:SDR family NAD(P)-dependent oxidoreductase [Shimia sp. R11_0]|uniref:SDR family NAD(P)-dependent oxidoreductase n=1 Tax=Shimia sp. R11_0 TaxID=2821096 RepID=UPI001ADB81D0|nr:SDR family NAD(P)-dependent oxidoreductase [Shimia sp. R11_0]MBO9478030.1 SDR family NAD(P)-dependent oxidoreductase [Shimia sp. R11_0]